MLGGHLEVVKWLHETHPDEGGDDAIDSAATGGHLEVIKWLHANRGESCTNKAMSSAAVNGHLEVVKWLYFNLAAKFQYDCLERELLLRHHDVVKWLHRYVNQSEVCTIDVVKDALLNGPLWTVLWLHNTFADLAPADLKGVLMTDCEEKFELLLFQHAHYPELVTLEVAATTSKLVKKYGSAAVKPHMTEWLKENIVGYENS